MDFLSYRDFAGELPLSRGGLIVRDFFSLWDVSAFREFVDINSESAKLTLCSLAISFLHHGLLANITQFLDTNSMSRVVNWDRVLSDMEESSLLIWRHDAKSFHKQAATKPFVSFS